MQRLNPERDEELYRAFKRAYSLPTTKSYQQAIRQAVNSPCSQFYVSAEEAYRFIRIKQKDQTAVVTHWRWGGQISKEKLRALRLIFSRFNELKQQRAFSGCSTYFVASFACTSPAPCFFISYHRAREIIRQMRKHGQVHHRKRYGHEHPPLITP